MSDFSQSQRKENEDSTIYEGEGGYYGRTPEGKRGRPPITGLSDVMRPILDRLQSSGLSRSLQEATILGIVERCIFGEGFDRKEFWDQPGLPNVSTYKKWRANDPVFVKLLEEAKTAGLKWRSQRSAERVEMAHDLLQHFAPEFVEALVTVALDSRNDFAKLQAATAGLDRAAVQTAPKGQTAVNLPGLESAIERIYGSPEPADKDDE